VAGGVARAESVEVIVGGGTIRTDTAEAITIHAYTTSDPSDVYPVAYSFLVVSEDFATEYTQEWTGNWSWSSYTQFGSNPTTTEWHSSSLGVLPAGWYQPTPTPTFNVYVFTSVKFHYVSLNTDSWVNGYSAVLEYDGP
jgi:hypothetical protein